ncbi:phosphoribosylanthranilate isomerase [Caldivirga maquilingensis]|uniref:N-(5'-phosphoribosyl)anthranilate isomerase n=1 Tax=Caldivirga maquilingensis (strain ATCC 700844 / DSM 13496 / JCM 10307 / IC-167) TaxID=397948 RepID=A8MDL7_CALMQ|nr:N-(5'-phosphoribosyl)anthranilate isomerase [Caldivirga maquilingensis]ABW01873.1 N-(5'phosphoribosyl)anthranilate isomerase (PRAI) [Caldivirga maquilingensis IC-167]
MTLLKVCGLTRRIDVEFIDKHADYAGFIIHSDVKTQRLLSPNEARDLASTLSKAKPVAVVRGLGLRDAVELATGLGFPILQYHGVVNVDEYLSGQGNINLAPVIEYSDDSTVVKTIEEYLTMSNVEYILIDAPKAGYRLFEYGLKIPLSIIRRVVGLSRIGVAGGIGPGNVKFIIKYNPFLIDVNSGVESSPGVKDWRLIMEVVKVIKGEGAP